MEHYNKYLTTPIGEKFKLHRRYDAWFIFFSYKRRTLRLDSFKDFLMNDSYDYISNKLERGMTGNSTALSTSKEGAYLLLEDQLYRYGRKVYRE